MSAAAVAPTMNPFSEVRIAPTRGPEAVVSGTTPARDTVGPPSYNASTSTSGVPAITGTSTGAPSDTHPTSESYQKLRRSILERHEEHTALHEEIAPLSALPSLASKTQEELYTFKGKLTSLQTASKRLDAQREASERKAKKLEPSFAVTLPSRKKKWKTAKISMEASQAECAQNGDQIARLQAKIAECQAAFDDASSGCESLKILENQLNRLDMDLFQGPTPCFGLEDELESMVMILSSTYRLVQAESEREKRARPKLIKALTPLQIVLTQLKEALAITMDAGVPTDTKYTRQLLVNGSPLTISKKITPLVQKAKTESGKGFTLVAEARGSQLLIKQLPKLKLLDLDKLPSKASGIDIKTSLSERSIHASLEVSYNQSQQQLTLVKKEIERSKRRTTFFLKRVQTLKAEEEKVKGMLRNKRRQIVLQVVGNLRDSLDGAEMNGVPNLASIDSAFEFNSNFSSTVEAAPVDQPEAAEIDGSESRMFQSTQDSFGNPIQDPGTTLIQTTLQRTQSTATGEETVPTIRTPHVSNTDVEGPLNPSSIKLKSIEALRKIMKECVRECNAADEDDELPGYNYIHSQ
ncbi:unnamed protein product [Sympodiomycopsis kandeliae]